MIHKKQNIIKLFPIIIIITLFQCCADEEVPKSTLILKDNILYKRGSDVPFTGREKALVEDKIIEYDVKDGYKHGEFKIYSEDGTLEIQGQIDSNRNVGKWQYYYPNGEIESEGNFVYDKPDGKWVWSYPDGNVKEEGYFEKGERIGIWFQYDHDGDIIYEHNYDLKDSTTESSAK